MENGRDGGIVDHLFRFNSTLILRDNGVPFGSPERHEEYEVYLNVDARSLSDAFNFYLGPADQPYAFGPNDERTVVRTTTMDRLPPILMFHIGRFNNSCVKVNDIFTFPADFNASDFVTGLTMFII
jgi:hypothetical protein